MTEDMITSCLLNTIYTTPPRAQPIRRATSSLDEGNVVLVITSLPIPTATLSTQFVRRITRSMAARDDSIKSKNHYEFDDAIKKSK